MKKNQSFIGIPSVAPIGAGDLSFDDGVFVDRYIWSEYPGTPPYHILDMEELPFSDLVPCMCVYLKVNYTHELVSVCVLSSSNTSLHWMKNMEVEFLIVSFHIPRVDLVMHPILEKHIL